MPSFRGSVAGVVVWMATTALTGAMASEIDRDLRQTVRARQVLLKHPDLATLNVGVSVRDRVATLWGAVPSAEASLRAERALRGLFELSEVRNELEVNALAETGIELLPALGVPTYLPDQLAPNLPRAQQPAPTATDRRALPKTAATPMTRTRAQIELPTIMVPDADLPARMPLAPEQKR